MKMRIYAAPAVCLAVALATGRPALSQAPPPPPVPAGPTTIWNFLGIPQGINKVRDATINRRGNFPGLERKPPLLSIADPRNLTSGVPAMEAAAEIKQAEDLKKQKIKAIKYLASIGCGCYDKDKKITKALIASMEDCTEEVRLAAVEAVITAAEGKECAQCHSACCCGKEVTEKLSQIAYERDDTGCFIEPSERVREAAKEALAVCCPNRLPLEAIEPPMGERTDEEVIPEGALPPEVPGDVPPPIPSPSDAPTTRAPESSAAPSGSTARGHHAAPRARMASSRRTSRSGMTAHTPANNLTAPAPLTSTAEFELLEPPSVNAIFESAGEEDSSEPNRRSAQFRPVSSRRAFAAEPADAQLIETIEPEQMSEEVEPASAARVSLSDNNASSTISVARGHVEGVDVKRGLVTVHLHGKKRLPVGSTVKVYHRNLAGRAPLTRLEVVASSDGVVQARGTEPSKLSKIVRGDEVIGW